MRKGLGKGTGKIGYYNLAPMDSHIHSLSAKGVVTYKKTKSGGRVRVGTNRDGTKNYLFFPKKKLNAKGFKVIEPPVHTDKVDKYGIVEFDGVWYYQDDKLRQFRKIGNPNNIITYEEVNKYPHVFLDAKGCSCGLKPVNAPDSHFSKKELQLGIKVEMEHTTNKELAEKIAKRHLLENPAYYKFYDIKDKKADEFLVTMHTLNAKELVYGEGSTYGLLQKMGIFCYASNREGDLFRSNKPQFKGIKIVGGSSGFTVSNTHPTKFGQYRDLPYNSSEEDFIKAIKEVKED